MKRFALRGLLVLAAAFLMDACASHDEVMTTSQPTGTVPGEKVSGEGMQPGAGPGGASANVRW
ncbi:MAG: hypothetical protein M3R29_05810 [Verrucomicrobiota bacterium]|nr:hypothetical protein [Verrucomicrobiota bacterium]